MTLIGHAPQRALFEGAFASGRPHHAWLLAGPEGVGKRRFADLAARMVLAGADEFAGGSGTPAAALIAAGSHPDLKVIEREAREDGRLKAEILIEQVRALGPLFHSTAGMGGWRVVIVDPVDAVREGAANAVLKMLEEPPAKTLFLLVSHSPGRLLPTIRSRARRLRFDTLADADSAAVIAARSPDATPGERAAMLALAAGAPGGALRHAGLGVDRLTTELDALAAATPAAARGRVLALGRALSGKTTQARYEAFLDLAPRRLAAAARLRRGPALAGAIERWESARDLAGSAVPLSLDPVAVVAELGAMLAGIDRERA